MADHEYYEELIAAGLDGELTPEESLELHAHLESCPRCRAFAQAMGAVAGAAAAHLPPPPADLTDRVMDAVRAQANNQKKKRPLPFPGRVLALAAMAALVLWAGAALLGPSGRSGGSAPAAISNSASDAVARADKAAPAGGADAAESDTDGGVMMFSMEDGAVVQEGDWEADAALPETAAASQEAPLFWLYAGENTEAQPLAESGDAELLTELLTPGEPAQVPDWEADYTLTYSEDGETRAARLWEADGTVIVSLEDGTVYTAPLRPLRALLAPESVW